MMRQRLTLTLALAATGAAMTAVPARAAFCGVPDDINPVVKLTIATYPKVAHTKAIDASYIKTVSVNGTYAYSVVDTGSQRTPFYWEKPTGAWQFASANKPPADFPKELLPFLTGGDCNNPNWKKHS
jgi:hypothetical protein